MGIRRIYLGLATVLIILLFSLSTSASTENKELELIVNANNAFALDMYSVLKNDSENLFFSPYSLSAAIAMTYAGARGSTAGEMADALHFTCDPNSVHSSFSKLNMSLTKSEKETGVQLSVANSIWPHKGYPFLPEFVDLIKEYYGAPIVPVDYDGATEQARNTINSWVEDATQDKILELIPKGSLDRGTLMALVNAVYFKGDWASQFDADKTSDCIFKLIGGDETRVDMMYQASKFGYLKLDKLEILELPYVNNSLSMVIILPEEGELANCENQLTLANLNSWLSKLTKLDMRVSLPRFKMIWGTKDLKKPLQNLGIKKAFSGEADFSGMDGTQSLSIGQVFHKAFIEVNEQGTEAAAATSVIVGRGSIKPWFRADHPFVFIIRDNATNSIMFLGRVLDPGN